MTQLLSAPITKLLYHQLYQFTQNKKIGVINSRGNIVLKPQFDRLEDSGDRVWVIKNGKKLPLSDFINLKSY
ncbi:MULTISPECIES: WG repeat-containing protein [Psychrobacter]|uniref:WG repeat-containing protein n=1 Tax=Psychrobacter TaxID=497 RepID=UPI00146D9833|nr:MULTISPECIES: WG repeat-containing protein [Psychrobacter]